MRPCSIALLSVASALSGCGSDDCADVVCGPCPEPATLIVVLPGAPSGTVVAIAGFTGSCAPSEAGRTTCFAGAETGAGAYAGTITADGYAPLDVSFTVREEPRVGCCACGYAPFEGMFTLVPLAPDDGGAPDAGVDGG